MKAKVQLEFSDYLTQKLYSFSRDRAGQAKKKKQTYLMSLVSLAFGLFFYFTGTKVMLVPMIIIALATFFFFPKYFDHKYKQHFEKFILKSYSNRFGVSTDLEFNKDHIFAKDVSGEGKINNDQITHIAELPQHFLAKLKMGDVLTIPKKDINTEELKQKFEELGFVIIDELNWEWGK